MHSRLTAALNVFYIITEFWSTNILPWGEEGPTEQDATLRIYNQLMVEGEG